MHCHKTHARPPATCTATRRMHCHPSHALPPSHARPPVTCTATRHMRGHPSHALPPVTCAANRHISGHPSHALPPVYHTPGMACTDMAIRDPPTSRVSLRYRETLTSLCLQNYLLPGLGSTEMAYNLLHTISYQRLTNIISTPSQLLYYCYKLFF